MDFQRRLVMFGRFLLAAGAFFVTTGIYAVVMGWLLPDFGPGWEAGVGILLSATVCFVVLGGIAKRIHSHNRRTTPIVCHHKIDWR